MSATLSDPIFFYAIAYVLFLILAWVFLRKPALKWLDGEIGKIRAELDDARRLRAEAETLLEQSRARKLAAQAEADAILNHAKEEARRLGAAAEANLHDVLDRHQQHALERIRILEQEAVIAVRTAVVDKAMALARKTLAERLDDAALARLADQAIADMPRLIAAKAKAA